MTTYNDDLALIIRYDGTKSAFDAVKANYVNKVVFITGTTDAPQQAIYVSDDGGGKYLDMSDINLVKQELAHLNLVSDGTTYKDWNGGKGIAFKGQNGITVSIVEKSYNVDGVATPFFDIVYDTSALQNDINTNKTNLSSLSTTVGNLSTDLSELETSVGNHTTQIGDLTTKVNKNEGDISTLNTNFSELEETFGAELDKTAKIGSDGKILETYLPDYILGQVMFGGIIYQYEPGGASELGTMYVTPSDIFKNKFDITDTTAPISYNEYETYEGVYFILNKSVSVFNLSTTTGDWIISTGNTWAKIDNTDAVTAVAGLTGNITASSLAAKLAATNDSNELALKSEVTAVKVTSTSSNTELIATSVDSTGRAITITPTTKLSDAIALAESAVQEVNIETTSDYITTSSSTSDDTTTLNFELTTATVDPNDTSNGLATAEDIRAFLAARLSVKVVK